MSRRINKAELISKVRELAGLTNDEKSALLEILNEKKTYGLVWENHVEDVEEQIREQLPVLHEVTERRILSEDADAPNHIIIEAENYHALVTLTYTHAGMVDVIYIDPPYNTGNKDFVYNDSYIDSEDSYRHSKWLSFMEKRMKIAKTLLSEKGVIFISIDDNEEANLKLLCDEVFGYDHYVACIAWQRTYSTRNDSKGMPKEVESILVYSKLPNWTPKKLPRTEKMNSLYKSPDNDPKPWTSSSISAPGAATHQGMVYAIQHPFTGDFMYPTIGRCWSLGQESMLDNLNLWCSYKLENIHDEEKRAEVCGVSKNDVRQDVLGIVLEEPFEIAKAKAKAILDRGNWPYFYFTNGGKGGLRRKTYLEDMEGRVATNFFTYEECGHTDEAKKEVISIFDGKAPFDTPKPTRLLKRILQIATESDSIILDFFAGSGTTMHATMQLNAEDGGHRQCILVTNNENNICEEVTYERNKRVINGYKTPKGVEVAGLKANTLRYYKTDFISRDRTQKNMRDLVKAATDLLCIKENMYQETKIVCNGKTLRKDFARRFSEDSKEMIIIYEPAVIKYIVEELKAWEEKEFIKIYVFSEGRYAYDDDFKDVLNKVTLCALPDAIFQTYRRVLPKRKKAQPVEIDLSEEEQEEALADAAQYSYKEKEGGEA